MTSAATKIPRPPSSSSDTDDTASSSVHEAHTLVRERRFPASELSSVLSSLRDSRSTGTLLIDMNQGGVGTIRFREEHPIRLSPK